MPDLVKPTTALTAQSVGASLETFEEVLTQAMELLGLPSQGVMVSFEQRRRALTNFADAIELLDDAQRARSIYLSKFMAAVGAGLFDAGLNYLWDETISELRRRIAGYDVQYFYEIAVPAPERRKQFQSEDDLVKVGDQDLIRASNELGLISDVGFQQLDLIRYMRNYASAAHPNQNQVSALQLLGWVETCIKEVITLPESSVVASTKRLLGNVRKKTLSAAKAKEISEFFDDLPQDRADNIAAGLFGMYVDPDSSTQIRDNVRLLMPKLWQVTSEDQRQDFGVKYGRFLANGDQEQADWSRELLDAVDAGAYLPENVRVSEIAAAVDDLLVAHRGYENFYTEPSRARALEALVGDRPVPTEVRRPYVRGVIEAFLTNGHGTAWNAEPHYLRMIARFSAPEAQVALLTFTDATIASRLQRPLAQEKFRELLDLIEPKLARRRFKELAEAIRGFGGPLSRMPDDARMKKLISTLAT